MKPDMDRGTELDDFIVEHGPNECWEWIGLRYSCTNQPCMIIGGGIVQAARIVAWQHRNGPIPEGMLVRHVCGSSACLNPRHMAISQSKKAKKLPGATG